MEVKKGIYPNCSEWDEQVEADYYVEEEVAKHKPRDPKNYPEINTIIEEIKKNGWDA